MRSFILFITILLASNLRSQDFPYETFGEVIFSSPDSAYEMVNRYFEECNPCTMDSGYAHKAWGNAAWMKGDLLLAASHFTKSVHFAEEAEDIYLLSGVSLNLGNVFNDLEVFGLSESYYLEFLKYNPSDGDGYNNLGTIMERKGELDSALVLYTIADSLYRKAGRNGGTVYTNSNIAKTLVLKGNLEEAVPYLERAMHLADSLNDLKMLAFNYESNSRLLGKQGKLKEALQSAHKSLSISIKGGFKEAATDGAFMLYTWHKEAGHTDSALYYRELSIAYKDSSRMGNNGDVGSLIAGFYGERIDKERALSDVKVLRLNNTLLKEKNMKNITIFLISGLLIVAVSIWRFQSLRIKKEKLQANQIRSQLHFKEKELLTSALKDAEVNNFLRELKDGIDHLETPNDAGVSKIRSMLKAQMAEKNRWEEFQVRFEGIHESFFQRLLKDHPDLTRNELKLSALTLLNLSSKEISSIQGIKPSSVDIARHRLRKRLNVENGLSLAEYLRSYTS